MKENKKPVIRMEFSKISSEISRIGTRIKRWRGNIKFFISMSYNELFGYRQKRDQQINPMPLKPLMVSLVERPVVDYKNYFK